MDSRSIGADVSFAWPINEIAVMGADGAADIIFRREIAESAHPEAVRLQRIEEYRERLAHPYYAAEHGLVDDVIDPRCTRALLSASLAALRSKAVVVAPRKHGNPPV
jgi:methylmalonyl-CoA decarboxylase subunit alpha